MKLGALLQTLAVLLLHIMQLALAACMGYIHVGSGYTQLLEQWWCRINNCCGIVIMNNALKPSCCRQLLILTGEKQVNKDGGTRTDRHAFQQLQVALSNPRSRINLAVYTTLNPYKWTRIIHLICHTTGDIFSQTSCTPIHTHTQDHKIKFSIALTSLFKY